MRLPFGIAVACVLVGPLSARAQDSTAGDADGRLAERTEEVRNREIAFAKTMADRDLAAFVRFVSPEAVFFEGERPLRGVDAIEAAWAPLFEEPTPPFSWHPDRVTVLESGDLAFSTGPVLSPAGELLGRFNSIWRRDPDGQWRIVFDKGS